MTQTHAETYFRPPSEAESFLIRVMQGCSHNRCTFCNMYKDVPLVILPVDWVLSGIDQDAAEFGEKYLPLIRTLYLEGGDPLVRKTEDLVRIMVYAGKRFPYLEGVAAYATARSVIRKSAEELQRLASAGLRRVYVGVESGLDEVLSSTCKGCTRADLLRCAELLAGAGIENDVSIMLGIAGPDLSLAHARATGELLSAMRPVTVRIRTFVPKMETPLGKSLLEGGFQLMGPHAILRELKVLVRAISAPIRLLSDHWSNYVLFDALVPDAQEDVLALLDSALRQPESSFRPTGMSEARQ